MSTTHTGIVQLAGDVSLIVGVSHQDHVQATAPCGATCMQRMLTDLLTSVKVLAAPMYSAPCTRPAEWLALRCPAAAELVGSTANTLLQPTCIRSCTLPVTHCPHQMPQGQSSHLTDRHPDDSASIAEDKSMAHRAGNCNSWYTSTALQHIDCLRPDGLRTWGECPSAASGAEAWQQLPLLH